MPLSDNQRAKLAALRAAGNEMHDAVQGLFRYLDKAQEYAESGDLALGPAKITTIVDGIAARINAVDAANTALKALV